PLNPESWMFHHPCVELTSLQAEAIGFKLYKIQSTGIKEEEVRELENFLRELKLNISFEAVVSGVIESSYQKTRIDDVCERLGLEHLTPLWRRNPEDVLMEIISQGFDVVFTAVAAHGFTEKWLNRRLDFEAFEELKLLNKKYGVHISLEGGEGETFVKDAPFFKKRIEFLEVEKIWKHDSGYLLVRRAVLINKKMKR
ncbi:MAG: diphthine--ammonia ligase, partial [Candidatus Bathyarchaeota archaeon]|nr:diphthine--ammonia ligase [Candidatus Bathyarchaeota archaeon]